MQGYGTTIPFHKGTSDWGEFSFRFVFFLINLTNWDSIIVSVSMSFARLAIETYCGVQSRH